VEESSVVAKDVQVPPAPALDEPVILPLQLTHGHQCLNLRILKVADLQPLVIGQRGMSVYKVEVAAHLCFPIRLGSGR
jgi:hypothetical protein